jgi:hypothetical protein
MITWTGFPAKARRTTFSIASSVVNGDEKAETRIPRSVRWSQAPLKMRSMTSSPSIPPASWVPRLTSCGAETD